MRFLHGCASISLTCQGRRFYVYSCCCPTSWDHNDRVDKRYSILDLILAQIRASAATPILGGDFNACMGEALPEDDVALLVSWGSVSHRQPCCN